MKEKNINLQLVDDHKNITNHGVVQLFTEPHPYRITKQLANKPEPPKIAKNVLWSQVSPIIMLHIMKPLSKLHMITILSLSSDVEHSVT